MEYVQLAMEERNNCLCGRELTEWSNFWYDKANTEAPYRILLVGDSVARQVRRTLSETINCPVDLFGSSSALRDRLFWDQWDCFFKNKCYKYNAIFVWVGNHSRMSEDGKSYFTEYDYNKFKNDFASLIDCCLQKSDNVIVLTTLHMYKWRKYNSYLERIRRKLMINKPKEYLNEQENVVVEGKNHIMKYIAETKGLKFYDIDQSLMKSRFWHTDFIHYIPESNQFVCNILKDLL